MGDHINFNGNIIRENEPLYKASSRAARFGDGLFETMRMCNGKILFEAMHEERLFMGLRLMKFVLPPHFNWDFLRAAIDGLIQKNQHHAHARVRLMITRGEGAIMEEPMHSPQFLVESWDAKEYQYEEAGLNVGVFRAYPKMRSAFANIKTCNFLPSVMAILHAKENGLDECLMINDAGRICDATISNIFWVRGGQLFTIPLSEGGVAGVMRSHLLKVLPEAGMPVIEVTVSASELHGEQEVFLTNVMRGVQWVKTLANTQYKNEMSRKIFEVLLASIS
jgi:branched-chain amino acid aminotransferase